MITSADADRKSQQQRHGLVPRARRTIHRLHLTSHTAAENAPVFRRLWEHGVKDRMPRAEAWIAQHEPTFAGRLTDDRR